MNNSNVSQKISFSRAIQVEKSWNSFWGLEENSTFTNIWSWLNRHQIKWRCIAKYKCNICTKHFFYSYLHFIQIPVRHTRLITNSYDKFLAPFEFTHKFSNFFYQWWNSPIFTDIDISPKPFLRFFPLINKYKNTWQLEFHSKIPCQIKHSSNKWCFSLSIVTAIQVMISFRISLESPELVFFFTKSDWDLKQSSYSVYSQKITLIVWFLCFIVSSKRSV